MLTLPTIKGMKVLGFVQTETDGEAVMGVVLVEKPSGKEWVTGLYRLGDNGWGSGGYHFDKEEALKDFFRRVESRIARPWITK